MIAGYSALEVRDFLRRYRFTDLHIEAAEDALVLCHRTAAIFMNRLKGLGFVEELDKWDGDRVFRLTIKGQALANASAASPIHRRTAERLLEQLLERVQRVNSTHEYPSDPGPGVRRALSTGRPIRQLVSGDQGIQQKARPGLRAKLGYFILREPATYKRSH